MTGAPDTMHVAYLVSQYPALSHAFIEREVHALRARGDEVTTFSIRATPPEQLRSAAMREDAESTIVVKDGPKSAFIRAHMGLLRRDPSAWRRVLAHALRTGPRSARARLWQLFYFAEAGVVYTQMKRTGVRHLHVHFANVAADVARLVTEIGREFDGHDAGWRWSMTMHGPTEFEEVTAFDLPAKVRDADAVACISDFCRSQLMRMVEPEHWGKLAMVRMSVDPAAYPPPADHRAGREGLPLRILYVGRLVPEKGGPILVEAVAELRDRGIPLQVRMVGAGELEDSLRSSIAENGLGESIVLTGPIGQDDLPEQYHWADVFVLPSFQEGLPVVLMEALSTALPVVTTRIAGIGELVKDGVMGAVIAPGRADLLADAIAALAASSEERLRMGKAGREAVLSEYTADLASAAMHDLLITTTARSASHGGAEGA